MRFWTSDIHFSHRNIREYEPTRQALGDSVEEMNEEIIRRWNEIVSPDDEVFVLGDVALGKISESLPLVSRLVGNLFLVPGNHDRCWIGNRDHAKWRDKYEAAGFIVAPEQSQAAFETSSGSVWANVCHFPYEGDSHDGDRYTEYRIPASRLPIIHGHVHGKWRENGRQFNVGMDVHDYRPISDAVIVEWLETLNGNLREA